MKSICIASGLLLGAALLAGCGERTGQTGPTGTATGAFAADVVAGKTSAVTDPVGDADKTAEAYLDIVRAEITKQGTNFVFVMTLAAPIPDNPPLPSWADVMVWQPILDTDPTASPVGYPFTKNTANAFEFFIQHRVYRSGFVDPLDPASAADVLVDRRPLLKGGQATVTPIKVTIDGAQITFVVDAALLGDPSTFSWLSVTAVAKAGDDVKNAYNKHVPFDFAPDFNLGAPLATWPL
ncbi:MAG: hypothetical protein E6I27_17685 [Chloroflexi bacterium]|uniref:Lipoprotein n=1 Tax=Candidatus Segetimicrobium genomatis TaxID=2569760 RepID=A0A537IT85_9BACT|nr:MAG: hypothetical protein AUH78_20635 [Gemmatimonadetes bacterium 13_1_40CM_4_69_8]TMF34553.1 MAG: hypothetical protein E6I27_17685 [Chloroflexota bacterium]TMI73896.1 MAG: hypothetical protein E6H05_08550 [Terrabacteria group bacterium ANGP1]